MAIIYYKSTGHKEILMLWIHNFEELFSVQKDTLQTFQKFYYENRHSKYLARKQKEQTK